MSFFGFSIFCPFFSKCLCTSLSLLLPLKGLEFGFRTLFTPLVRESKKLSDFGFNSVYFGFHVLHSSLCQWKCMPQWDSVFLALYSRFQSPGFRIPQAKISRFLESEFLKWGESSKTRTFIKHVYHLRNLQSTRPVSL